MLPSHGHPLHAFASLFSHYIPPLLRLFFALSYISTNWLGMPLGNAQRRARLRASPGSPADLAESNTVVTTQHVVQERLAAFAPFTLPSLAEAIHDGCPLSSSAGTTESPEPSWLDALVEAQRRHTEPVTVVVIFLYAYLEYAENRVEPCAKLECWEEAQSGLQGNSLDEFRQRVSATLLSQYGQVLWRANRERLLHRISFSDYDSSRKHFDVAHAEQAKYNGRLVIHYNGHGLPPATALGEVWMVDKERNNFIPFSLLDAAAAVAGPIVFVVDADSAGSILQPWARRQMAERKPNVIFLCACSDGEILPQQPALPADLLTSCLTTPMRCAIEWYLYHSSHAFLIPNVPEESIRSIITRPTTPLYKDLFTVLSAVLDSIAWSALPSRVYDSLFCRDRTTRVLFRNFVLATHVGVGAGCQPVSHPPLDPSVATHALWSSWEFAVEQAICQIPVMKKTDWSDYVPTSFFEEQMMAFRLWIERSEGDTFAAGLPCVLHALKQPRLQLQALQLLIQFMDVSWAAGSAAIVCGAIPFLTALRNSPSLEWLLLILWMLCARADVVATCAAMESCGMVEWVVSLLLKPTGEMKIVPPMELVAQPHVCVPDISSSTASAASPSPPPPPAASVPTPLPPSTPAVLETDSDAPWMISGVTTDRCKSIACFTLCLYMRRGVEQCVVCWNANVLDSALRCLHSSHTDLCSWACLLLATLFNGLHHARAVASQHFSSRLSSLTGLLSHTSPVVRSSCVTLLGSLVGSRIDLLHGDGEVDRQVQMEKKLMILLRPCTQDASMVVRHEVVFFVCCLLYVYYEAVENRNLSTIEEYVMSGEQAEEPWTLVEVEVRVKSILNCHRPTTNAQFADQQQNVVVETIMKDDEQPSFPLELKGLSSSVMSNLQGIVKDAAKMLRQISRYGDAKYVQEKLQELSTGAQPTSDRQALEALRTMSKVVEEDVKAHPTEADRSRTCWNYDAMGHIVMDMEDRRLEPAEQPTNASTAASLRLSDSSRRSSSPISDSRSIASSLSPAAAPYHHMASTINAADPIVCSVFRTLESQLVVVTKKQKLYTVSYESYSGLQVLCEHQLSSPSPIRDLHVINDLSEQVGLLGVTKQGGFVVFKGGVRNTGSLAYNGLRETSTFAGSQSKSVSMKTSYSASTATLFYGGPIGEDGTTAIHGLSLVEEQVTQRQPVVGALNITALTVSPVGSSVFVGFDDSVVRYYDDRQGTGRIGPVAEGRCANRGGGVGLGKSGATPLPVIGCGPIATGTNHTVVAATPTELCVFDTRKWREPIHVVSHASLYGSGGRAGGPAPLLSRCAVGAYTGLVGVCFDDARYGAFNTRGALLCERLQKITGTKAHSDTCIAHPLRPLMSMSGDVLCL